MKEMQQKLYLEPISLVISIALLPLLIVLAHNSINFNGSLTTIQNVSANFFVRCNAGLVCVDILMPFLGYVLHAYDSTEKILVLWVLVNITLTCYLSHEILKSNVNVAKKITVVVIWSIAALGVNYGAIEAESIPCINCSLISFLKMAQNQQAWEPFALAALLLNLELGALFFVILILVLLAQSISKNTRLLVIKIVRQIFIGCAAIFLYLSMIEFSFF